MRPFHTVVPAILVLLAAAITLIAGPRFIQGVELARVRAAVTVAEARLDGGTALDTLEQATRAVADSVMPGVVHIDVRVRPDAQENEAVKRLRERLGGRETPELPPGHPGLPSTGSGWVYDRAGHIVTNSHVVRDAESISVEFNDGRVFNASVVGRDEATDVAVLALEGAASGGEFFPLRRAQREAVYVGDRVFAFGSPFGFKFSMSQGIISALGRSEAATFVGMLGGYTNYIQTDAAMNPGNSGGPLVNSRGRVIGMNTAIANSRTEGRGEFGQGQNAGLGFAIPVETIDSVVEQLVTTNIVIRGFMGLRLGEITPRQAEAAGFNGRGVMIDPRRELDADMPAAKAGLKPGDIIVSLDAKPATDTDVLRSLISIRRPGEVVTLSVWRNGASVEVQVKLGAAYTRIEGPGFYVPVPIPGGDEMTMDQIREWVRKQEAGAGPEPQP